MAHITELASALQTALNKDVIHNWPEAKVILDPDGDNIDLSSRLKNIIVSIKKKKNINPDESFGRISISEIKLKFKNDNNYFSPEYIDGPFYHQTTRLYNAYTAGTSYIDVPKDFTVQADLKIFVSRDKKSDNAVISSINTSNTYYNRLTFTANLSSSNSYTAGSMVETNYRVGNYVMVSTVLKGSGAPSEDIDQYKGVITKLPRITLDGAELTIQDTLRDLLSTQLRANTTKSMSDTISITLTSSLEITREGSSTGTLDENAININENYCQIGSWNIEFTSATAYTVTDPGGVKYEGTTISTFYAGDSDVYQLSIPTSAWAGSFETGDEIDFNTYCTICYANESTNGNTAPKIIELLLTETYGADFSASDYDTAAITQLKADFADYRAGATFDKAISILKAIEIMLRHINAAVFVQNSGPVSFKSHRPQLEPDTPNELSPDADIKVLDLEHYNKYARVVGKYDYGNGQFNKEFSYPFNEGEPHITVKLPAYTSTERIYAESIVKKIYNMWERGQRIFNISEKWNHGIGFEINDQFSISSDHPDINSIVVEAFEMQKGINNAGAIKATAYDISYHFGRYAWTNVHLTNDGRVTW